MEEWVRLFPEILISLMMICPDESVLQGKDKQWDDNTKNSIRSDLAGKAGIISNT